jgi:uncharacterized protein YwgA
MLARDPRLAAARIVQDAGGQLVGRTRLQKITFLMQLAGFSEDFSFEYRHYGPYSEDLAQAMEIATLLGPVREVENIAEWGGRYSIYSVDPTGQPIDEDRANFVQQAKRIDAVELELAATAAYLYAAEGFGMTVAGNPWHETRRRKPTKAANGRLEKAAQAYEELRKTKTPRSLPALPTPA